MRLSAVFVLVLAAVAVGDDAARRAANDTVTVLEGEGSRARTGVLVESAGYDQVVLVQGAKRIVLPAGDVVAVRYGDAPPEYEEGERSLAAGDPETAQSAFESAVAKRGARAWLLEHGALGAAEAWLALAARDAAPKEKAEKAALTFVAARAANPRSLATDRILVGLSRSLVLAGRIDEALAACDDLLAVARTARRPAWELDANLARAEALSARGDANAALRALDDVLSAAESRGGTARDRDTALHMKRAASRAAARKTWLLVAEAENAGARDAIDRARRFCDELAARADLDGQGEAAVANTRGALLLLAGEPTKALRQFQEAEVLHFDVPEEAARAVWYEAKCQAKLGDETRRRERLAELADAWAGTAWARRAR